jgi:hypothetical protein
LASRRVRATRQWRLVNVTVVDDISRSAAWT